MLMKRIVSTFLLVLMLVSACSLTVIAAEEATTEETTEVVYEFNTNKTTPTMNYLTGEYKPDPESDYSEKITTQEQKLELMDLRLEDKEKGYRIYVDEYSGEVAIQSIKTGDVMFSNPYNVSSSTTLTNTQKAEALSQILITYKDTSNNNQPGSYTSFQHSAHGGADLEKENETTSQITVKYIKNGIRVEYSIGRMDTRYLVPERITQDAFETNILATAIANGCSAGDQRNLKNFFKLADIDEHMKKFENATEEKQDEEREKFLKLHPEAKNGPVYEFTGATKKEYKAIEAIIKKYCPDYTYEELDAEHLELNYTPEDKNEALFNVALEYTLNDDGFSVRLPANGIRFDESIYRLESIVILPFMGAGLNPNEGYTLFPDGSGALFDFQELAKRKTSSFFYGEIYGDDFAFYELGEIRPHNEVVRYPVYGLRETVVAEDGTTNSRGYVAIIEEGDSMIELGSYHTPEYNSVRMSINPRPYDQYELSDAISVAGDAVWTVVAPRKYTGNVTTRYIMLADSEEADEASGKPAYVSEFEPTYVGMAKAYRNYLIENGTLTALTDEDVQDDIPLYIETFGAIETTEKFLSIPYDTMKALTSFDDIRKMQDDLSDAGITNINFVLTGYTDGGLNIDQVPYYLDWDGAVEKDTKFEELLKEANDEGYGIFPDFDFAFASTDELFDGLTRKDHAVMTIDGRYTSKREYSATRQAYVSYFELAMSPAYYDRFITKLTKNYAENKKYKEAGVQGISVSSLGSYLNSDFDEDEPYNREDSKEFTAEAFAYLAENYNSVMTSGGNAYTWKYVDYITDIATDSSRHARSSATVPFLGIVLHGYIQTAGEPINMEGNVEYAMLRSIENGAALKFILSYRNTEKLKEYIDTNMYYSVRYDIWYSDLIARYNEINSVLKDVQLSTIENHIFLDGQRIPDNDEILGDSEQDLTNAINKEIQDAADEKEYLRVTLQSVRKYTIELKTELPAVLDVTNNSGVEKKYAAVTAAYDKMITNKNAYDSRLAAFNAAEEAMNADKNEKTYTAYVTAGTLLTTAANNFVSATKDYQNAVLAFEEAGLNTIAKYEFARDNFHMLEEYEAYPQTVIDEIEVEIAALEAQYNLLVADMAAKQEVIKAQLEPLVLEYADSILDFLNKLEEEEEEEFDKYAAATNSIVYEEYSNGKAIILNFNNYAVKVMYKDVYYTVDAYGYAVISG